MSRTQRAVRPDLACTRSPSGQRASQPERSSDSWKPQPAVWPQLLGNAHVYRVPVCPHASGPRVRPQLSRSQVRPQVSGVPAPPTHIWGSGSACSIWRPTDKPGGCSSKAPCLLGTPSGAVTPKAATALTARTEDTRPGPGGPVGAATQRAQASPRAPKALPWHPTSQLRPQEDPYPGTAGAPLPGDTALPRQ